MDNPNNNKFKNGVRNVAGVGAGVVVGDRVADAVFKRTRRIKGKGKLLGAAAALTAGVGAGSFVNSAIAGKREKASSFETLTDAVDDALTEFQDLGYTPSWMRGEGSADGDNVRYPSFHVSDQERALKLEREGSAVIRYKLRSRGESFDKDGTSKHRANMDVMSIDPIATQPVGAPGATELSELSSVVDECLHEFADDRYPVNAKPGSAKVKAYQDSVMKAGMSKGMYKSAKKVEDSRNSSTLKKAGVAIGAGALALAGGRKVRNAVRSRKEVNKFFKGSKDEFFKGSKNGQASFGFSELSELSEYIDANFSSRQRDAGGRFEGGNAVAGAGDFSAAADLQKSRKRRVLAGVGAGVGIAGAIAGRKGISRVVGNAVGLKLRQGSRKAMGG